MVFNLTKIKVNAAVNPSSGFKQLGPGSCDSWIWYISYALQTASSSDLQPYFTFNLFTEIVSGN